MGGPKRASRLPHLGENLCWLCWNDRSEGRKSNPVTWGGKVAGWLGAPDDLARAESLLGDQSLATADEITKLSAVHAIEEQDLGFSRLSDAVRDDFPRLNLQRLLESIQPKTKAQLAEELGVHPSAFSRWMRGQTPDRSARKALRDYFGLRGEIDLIEEPLFLSYLPLTHGERVNWVRARVGEVSPIQLREMFPALSKLLS